MNKISVVFVEDHDLTRIGLIAALQQVKEIEVVGEAANGRQGLQKIAETRPDVAIIDIGLPDIDGIAVTQHLKKSQLNSDFPATRVLILTMQTNEDAVWAAFAAGADSYLLKDVNLDNLVQAIQMTHEGNAWIDPTIARIVLKHAQASPVSTAVTTAESLGQYQQPTDDSHNTREIASIDSEAQQLLDTAPLTPRELDVLELIVSGCNNAQIAEKLFITVGTVKTHVRNILNKLCVDDRTQAAVRALRSGLVD